MRSVAFPVLLHHYRHRPCPTFDHYLQQTGLAKYHYPGEERYELLFLRAHLFRLSMWSALRMQWGFPNIRRRTESSFGPTSHWHRDPRFNLHQCSQWPSVSFSKADRQRFHYWAFTSAHATKTDEMLAKIKPRKEISLSRLARVILHQFCRCPLTASPLPFTNSSLERRKPNWWWKSGPPGSV